MMPHNHGKTVLQDAQTTAIVIAQWLIVGLPQDLADALAQYAASLGPEVTPAEAVRRVLHEVLLGQEPPYPPAA
jgi:hypothetical protein